MRPRNFQELYCEKHGLGTEQYAKHIRQRALYPHARLFTPFLTLFNGDYLAADNDFIQDVAQLTRYNDFFNSSFEYIHHPANHGLLRRWLKLRVSTERMRRIVRGTFSSSPYSSVDNRETMTPFRPKDHSDKNSGDPQKST